MSQYSKAAIAQKRSAQINCPHQRVFKNSQRVYIAGFRLFTCVEFRWQFVIYVCVKWRQFVGKHCKRSVATPGQNPAPQNSVKLYVSSNRRFRRCYCGLALLRGTGAAPLVQRELGKDRRRNRSRKKPAPSALQRTLKQG